MSDWALVGESYYSADKKYRALVFPSGMTKLYARSSNNPEDDAGDQFICNCGSLEDAVDFAEKHRMGQPRLGTHW